MPANQDNLIERQPVVVVMGHVDHGKTTLLDYIRKANVAGREAGGITQAIGAYEIEHKTSDGKLKKMTFIDTPGHEAFSKMRSRGAQTADLAILVVAAEEGVKPQTKEAIEILEATKTSFVVAFTKVDKPGADVEKVKNDLMNHGVFLEGYGGSTSYQPLSGKTGEGVDELLDLLVLAAEVEELRYDPKASATGFILETRTNKNRGMEATVIVRDGVLRRGDDISTPTAKGKVKILENFLGKAVNELPAGAPALIVGWDTLPQVGELVVTGQAAAEQVMSAKAEGPALVSSKNSLNLTLKSADAGSLEVLSQIVRSMTAERPIKIISESVGEVSENDIKMAVSGGAAIIAFKSKTDKAAKILAEAQAVNIISSDIVYELVIAIESMLKESAEKKVGELEVLAVFNQTRLDKQVIGGKVVSGSFRKMAFEARRGEERLGTGRVTNLQQGKEDTSEVREGLECGLMVTASFPVSVGDRLVILPELK